MNFGLISLALVSFLLSSILLFAFFNRNHYPDLVIAAIASFSFGIASLLSAFRLAPVLSAVLRLTSEFLIVISISMLIIRLGRNMLRRIAGSNQNKDGGNDDSSNGL
ncbi:MAG: hypothetical protein HY779_01795 [Rubrobacteridae bacterium]|nr:hypothetical protein [Rubrobacteridae bacterium]